MERTPLGAVRAPPRPPRRGRARSAGATLALAERAPAACTLRPPRYHKHTRDEPLLAGQAGRGVGQARERQPRRQDAPRGHAVHVHGAAPGRRGAGRRGLQADARPPPPHPVGRLPPQPPARRRGVPRRGAVPRVPRAQPRQAAQDGARRARRPLGAARRRRLAPQQPARQRRVARRGRRRGVGRVVPGRARGQARRPRRPIELHQVGPQAQARAAEANGARDRRLAARAEDDTALHDRGVSRARRRRRAVRRRQLPQLLLEGEAQRHEQDAQHVHLPRQARVAGAVCARGFVGACVCVTNNKNRGSDAAQPLGAALGRGRRRARRARGHGRKGSGDGTEGEGGHFLEIQIPIQSRQDYVARERQKRDPEDLPANTRELGQEKPHQALVGRGGGSAAAHDDDQEAKECQGQPRRHRPHDRHRLRRRAVRKTEPEGVREHRGGGGLAGHLVLCHVPPRHQPRDEPRRLRRICLAARAPAACDLCECFKLTR